MNIYVANFNTELSDNALFALFTPFGKVESAVIAIDGFTGLSRGFGYIDMPDMQEAQAAIDALDKHELEGQILTVNEAEMQEARRGSYKVGNPAIQGYLFRKS